MRRVPIRASLAALAALALAGCGSAAGSGADTSATPGAPSGGITVLAAASLTEAFTTLGDRFEGAHPGVTVTFSFAASSALATQIVAGSPADVFASASGSTMTQVVDAGRAATPTTFATNSLQIAVPKGNPAGISALADLAKPGVTVALCQPQVPCGAAATTVLANASLTITPATLEPDVKSVLSKVTLGEVDAGLVYVTDVAAAGDAVQGITIPADVNATTAYPIATLNGSANAATATAFVDYVLSPEGRTVLTAAGFAAP